MKFTEFTVLMTVAFMAGLGTSVHADPSLAEGAKLWAETCSRCHNMRDPQEFNADLWHPIVAHMRVRAGITGEEARAILAFLHNSAHGQAGYSAGGSNTNAAITETLRGASGSDLYQGTCIACHGADGNGKLPGMPDLKSPKGPLAKPTQELVRNVLNGYQSNGSTFAMPPKGGNNALTAEQVKAIVVYMKDHFYRK